MSHKKFKYFVVIVLLMTSQRRDTFNKHEFFFFVLFLNNGKKMSIIISLINKLTITTQKHIRTHTNTVIVLNTHRHNTSLTHKKKICKKN